MKLDNPFAADYMIKQIVDNYVKPFDMNCILYVVYRKGRLCINRRKFYEQSSQSIYKQKES